MTPILDIYVLITAALGALALSIFAIYTNSGAPDALVTTPVLTAMCAVAGALFGPWVPPLVVVLFALDIVYN